MWTFFGADGELKRVDNKTILVIGNKECCELHLTSLEQEEWISYLTQHIPPEKVYSFQHRKATAEEVLELIRRDLSVIQ